MAKFKITDDGQHAQFLCPGCNYLHMVSIKPYHPSGWEFNGSLEAPTIHPSVLLTTGHHVRGQKQPPDCYYCNERAKGDAFYDCTICHSFIKDGMIQFLDDCTHALKGKTVSLPTLPSP